MSTDKAETDPCYLCPSVPFLWLNFFCGHAFPVILALLFTATFTRAATVHKTDDTVVTGDLTGIKDGRLTVSAKPNSVEIPLDDILQIVMKTTQAAPPVTKSAPTPKPAAPAPSEEKDTVLGSLFGGHRAATTKAAATSASRPAMSAHPTTAATSKPTTQISNAPMVVMTLTDGDVLHAKLFSWSDQKLSVKSTAGPSLELPSTAVSEIWFGATDMQTKAKSVSVEPGPEDVAYVTKDADVLAVKGLVIGFAGDSLQFRYGDEDRKIAVAKLVGLKLRSNFPAPIAGFHQLVHIDTGDQFSGTLTSIDHDTLLLATPAARMKIQLSSISSIDFVNGKVSSLCDLKPSKVEQTPYFGRVMPFQIDKSLTGGSLLLSDGPCARGIAVHSRCLLEYDVSSGFERLKTRLGFQLPEGQPGRVLARVLGDGKVLYENQDARGDQPPVDIDVPLTGVKTLSLLIDFGKDQDVGDRVVWANPRLVRGK